MSEIASCFLIVDELVLPPITLRQEGDYLWKRIQLQIFFHVPREQRKGTWLGVVCREEEGSRSLGSTHCGTYTSTFVCSQYEMKATVVRLPWFPSQGPGENLQSLLSRVFQDCAQTTQLTLHCSTQPCTWFFKEADSRGEIWYKGTQ